MHPLLVLQRAASGVPDPADDGKTRWNDDEARTHPSITAIAPLDNPNVPLCPHLPASTADRGSSSSTETVTVPEVDSSPPMLSAMAAGDSTAASSTTASPITASSLCDDALPGSEQLPLPAHIFEEALKHIQSASLDISNSIASSPQTPTTPPPLNHVSVTDFLLAGSPSSLSDLQQHLDPLTISNPKESLSIFPPSTTTITEVEEIQQSPPTVSPTASPLSINASTIIYHQLAPPGKNDQTKHEYSRPPCVRCKKSKIHCTYLPGTTKCLNCKQGKRCCLPSGTPYTRLPPPDPNTTTNADDETTPRLMAVMTSDQLSPYLSDASTLVMTSPPQQLANPSLAYNQIYHPPSQPPPQQSQPRPPHSHSHSHHQVAHPQHQPQQQQQQQQQQFEEDPEVQRMINEQYFPPTLIVRGIVSPEEVQQLFSIFYTHLNPHAEILDPDYHTIPLVLSRFPLVFTIVCTIASRFLGSRPDLYPESLSITKEALALACFSTEDPITGARSGRDSPLDVCLALILWVTWMQPVRTSLEGVTNTGADKRWVWTGIAMRLAESHHLYRQQKLNGAVDSQGELAECSSVLNICTTVDRTFIILRPSSIKAIIPGTDPSSGALGSSATAAASAAVATPKGSSSTTALQTTLSTTVLARRTAADQDVDPSSDFRQLQSPSSPFATTHPQYTSPLKRAKQLQSQIVNVMTGFLSDALGPADNEKSAASFRVHVGSGNGGNKNGHLKFVQKCGSILDHLEDEVSGLRSRATGHGGPQIYLNNIQLDVWYYRLVLYTFELQAVMEESNSSSSRSDKAAKAKPRPRTKTSRPSYASKSREVLVPVCISRAQAMLQFICDSFPPRAAIEFLPERILGQTTAAALLMIEILYHPTLSSYICEDTAIYTSTLNNWANVMQMASAQYPFDQARTCSSAVYSRLVREQANVRSILYSSAASSGAHGSGALSGLSLSLAPSPVADPTSPPPLGGGPSHDVNGYQYPHTLMAEKNLPVQLLECAYSPPVLRLH